MILLLRLIAYFRHRVLYDISLIPEDAFSRVHSAFNEDLDAWKGITNGGRLGRARAASRHINFASGLLHKSIEEIIRLLSPSQE